MDEDDVGDDVDVDVDALLEGDGDFRLGDGGRVDGGGGGDGSAGGGGGGGGRDGGGAIPGALELDPEGPLGGKNPAVGDRLDSGDEYPFRDRVRVADGPLGMGLALPAGPSPPGKVDEEA
jgi:hypothetical protein